MALLTLLNASLAFGHVALLDHADFSLETSERIGLIGRNGTGKSSLLKILGGMERPDDGSLHVQQGIRIAYVAQEPVLKPEHTIFESVREGLAEVVQWIDDYTHSRGDLDTLQSQIESMDGWSWEQRVDETLQRLQLNPNAVVQSLSGGMRKRVALAQALVTRPDVLLLDEPTNHLDLNAITWLEDLLIDFKGSVIAITHDRAFLDRIATRIVELDRGKLRPYPGNYAQYQIQKEEQLAQEAVIQAKADKLLAQEEVWIRKGVEARRTRSQSRITRLQNLRNERAARREKVGNVKMEVASGVPSGKLVAELTEVSKSFTQADGSVRTVIQNFTGTLLRGDKIGLLGPNGAGKTTLLKLILGELEPDSGNIRRGTNLSVAYFDQMREQIDLDATLEDFGQFFGTGGVMDNYFRKYLQPYVNTSTTTWSWQPGAAQKLGISPGVLQTFQRAANIRDAFFRSSGGTQPAVRFELKPVAMDANISQFLLDLDGQQLSYDHGPSRPVAMQWPNPGSIGVVRLSIMPPSAAGRSGVTLDGPWAWFRLLEQSDLTATNSPDRFNLRLRVDGASISYELRASSAFNPFKSRVLSGFSLPERL